MVLITSWAPVLARSTPGTPPQKAPPKRAGNEDQRDGHDAGQIGHPRQRSHVGCGNPAGQQLPFGADVEQPGPEGESQGQG